MPRRLPHQDEWGQPVREGGPLRTGWLVVGAIVIYVIGALSGGPVWSKLMATNSSSPATLTPIPENTSQSIVPASLASRIYKMASPSIYTITAVSKGTQQTGPQEDIGTGFLIDNQGDVATNDHVVAGATTVTVTIGSHTVVGRVIGADKLDDLAIVKIPPPGDKPLSLGNANIMVPGDPVVAIGNPFQLTLSVTSGIISGINRPMQTSSGRMMTGLLQTDAPLNPGNSGGPLFDSQGQVIGIDTAIESPVQGSVGIGFAIPINRLEKVLPRLLAGEPVPHPWIGIEGANIDPQTQIEYHLPVSQGILVLSVVKGGPAQLAGVHPDTGGLRNPVGDGDIIVAVNGKPVPTVAALTEYISNYRVGTIIHLTILRHGKKIVLPLKLQNWNQ